MPHEDPARAFEALMEPASLTPVKENWLILYKGKPMRLKTNGKFRWNKKNHALTALTQAWNLVMDMQRPPSSPHYVSYVTQQLWLGKFKRWREKNIQFVRQEDYKNEA